MRLINKLKKILGIKEIEVWCKDCRYYISNICCGYNPDFIPEDLLICGRFEMDEGIIEDYAT